MRIALLLWTALAAISAARAETVALQAAESQPSQLAPYRMAELTIRNSAPSPVETVLLRPAGGGPTIRQRVALPPGQESKVLLPAPAIWPVQQYAVTMLGAGGATLGEASAEITWPADLATTDSFIDDGFAAWRGQAVAWPAAGRGKALLLLGTLVAAAAGTLFVRRAAIRIAALLAAVVAVCLLVPYAPSWPPAVEARTYALFLHDEGSTVKGDSFTVLSARRTAPFSLKARSIPYPVYPDRKAAFGDDAIVDPADMTISLTLRPGEVRIVRPAWAEGPSQTPALKGSIRRQGQDLTIQADFISRRALLVENDRVWPLSVATGHWETTVAASSDVTMGLLLSQMDRRDLRPEAAPLIRYWRDRHQQAGRACLFNFVGRGETVRLDVVTLRESPATSSTSAPFSSAPLAGPSPAGLRRDTRAGRPGP